MYIKFKSPLSFFYIKFILINIVLYFTNNFRIIMSFQDTLEMAVPLMYKNTPRILAIISSFPWYCPSTPSSLCCNFFNLVFLFQLSLVFALAFSFPCYSLLTFADLLPGLFFLCPCFSPFQISSPYFLVCWSFFFLMCNTDGLNKTGPRQVFAMIRALVVQGWKEQNLIFSFKTLVGRFR